MSHLIVGQRVDFIHNHPAGTSHEILTGVVMEVSASVRNGVEYKIQPDNKYRMARWRKPVHIVAVGEVHNKQAA